MRRRSSGTPAHGSRPREGRLDTALGIAASSAHEDTLAAIAVDLMPASSVDIHASPARGLRAVDLFSGAGGLSCGYEWSGAGTVVGAVEIDHAAAATFAFNHPSARVWTDDIRKVTPDELGAELGPVDVVLGGPMCQGVSQRGPRDPRDERNVAFWSFAEYVRALRPNCFVMENVPAIASDVHNRGLAIAVFEELESLGYHLSAEVVCAAWFGVPQLRYRLIVLGSLDAPPVFPPSVRAGIEGQLIEADFVTVGDAISDLPPVAAGGGVDRLPCRTPRPTCRPTRPCSETAPTFCAITGRPIRRPSTWIASGTYRREATGMTSPWTSCRRGSGRFGCRITRQPTAASTEAIQRTSSRVCAAMSPLARLRTRPSTGRSRYGRPRAYSHSQTASGLPARARISTGKVGNAVPALMARRIVEALVGGEPAAMQPGEQLSVDGGWRGRITLDVLKRHPDGRLPFVLAPRYKQLFGKRVHRRRRDLVGLAAAA
jgi:site-specific DNA-cytosine methylase